MKNIFRVLLMLVVGGSGLAAKSKPKVEEQKQDVAKTAPKSAPNLGQSTDSSLQHNFEDLLVQGKFHFSDEAVSTVEEDKVLDSLIGVRTDFKDRIQQSSGSF
jgi:hypothetical protein